MKRIISVVIVSLAAMFACAEGEEEDAYITLSIPDEIAVISGVFQIGFSMISTKNVEFQFHDMTLDKAMVQFGGLYDSLYKKMIDEGVSSSIASANISAWATYMSQALIEGIAIQQKKEQDELVRLTLKTEQDIRDVASKSDAAAERISSLQSSYNTSYARTVGKVADLAAILDARLTEAKKDLEDSIEELKNAEESGAPQEDIDSIKSDITEHGVELNKIKEAIKKCEEDIKTMKTAQKTVPETISASIAAFSNDMNNVTRWLGYKADEEHPLVGKFLIPKKSDGSAFDPDNDTILEFIDDRWDLTNKVNSITNTLRVATNVLFNANGGVTNVIYDNRGMLATLFGYIIDPETGERIVTETDGGITNIFTANINVANGFDGKSVWTNGEKQVEIKGFNGITGGDGDEFLPFAVSDGKGGRVISWKKNVPTMDGMSIFTNMYDEVEIKGFDEAEYYKYGMIPVRMGGHDIEDEPRIEWQTNSFAALRKIVGLKRNPTEEEMENDLRVWASIDGLTDAIGILAKLYSSTGIVQSVNKAINVEAAYDNASVWTNGAAKVEIKGFKDVASPWMIPVRRDLAVPQDEGEEVTYSPSIMWMGFPQGDANVSEMLPEGTHGLWYSITSRDEGVIVPDSDVERGGLIEQTTLYGFGSAAFGAVPYLFINDFGDRFLNWTEPPEDVSSPKVLTFNGNDVVWGDAGSGCALAFYGNNGSAVSRQTAIVVGSGSVTNDVKFASASDSNVKVTCTSDNNGGVVVTIGVYYQ